ncbi:hypothetical protein JTB14_037038 [Gonioctena quinquepunctata]|nr:hypothetical protein JTB14_037038 [Gonioctena quinquepunctata]
MNEELSSSKRENTLKVNVPSYLWSFSAFPIVQVWGIVKGKVPRFAFNCEPKELFVPNIKPWFPIVPVSDVPIEKLEFAFDCEPEEFVKEKVPGFAFDCEPEELFVLVGVGADAGSEFIFSGVKKENAKEELKTVIGDLSELKYEIQTNNLLKLLTSQSPDANIYNEYIMEHANGDDPPTHFHTIWLLSECYRYRRIRQIFENTKILQNYDPFQSKKEETYSTDLTVIRKVGKHCVEIVSNSKEATKNEFIVLMKTVEGYPKNMSRNLNWGLLATSYKAKMVFFKGDLNYRKLFGEKNWDPTSIEKGLNSFNPTKLAILRIVKADIVCGLQQEVVEKVEASNPK